MMTMPQVYNQPAPAKVAKEAAPPDDAERIRQRLAIKQAALAALGLDYEADDEDIENEKRHLPSDGGLVKLPDMVVEPREYRQAPQEEAALNRSQFANAMDGFTPEDPTEDPLDEEEMAIIADLRKKKREQGPFPMPVPIPDKALQPQDVIGSA